MRSKAEHDQWEKLIGCKQITVNGEDNLEYNLQLIKKALVAEGYHS